MIELGQLEEHWQEFEAKKVRVVVISIEDQEAAKATQAEFPHLIVVSDEKRKLADAIEVIHKGANPHGGDSAAPTTILIDGTGHVRWIFRPSGVFDRLSPAQLLAAVDREMPAS